jgi:FKBP-type peptidyl-prolyl cis-trans isomerase
MANSATPSKTFYTPTHKADGTKLSRAERKAANKAKWAAEQAAKRKASKSKKKTKAKAKVKTAEVKPSADRMKLTDIKQWSEAHPTRKTMSALDLSDWMTQGRTKTAKRLDRKGRIDSQMSKRNNRLEVQAQYKGGQLAAF